MNTTDNLDRVLNSFWFPHRQEFVACTAADIANRTKLTAAEVDSATTSAARQKLVQAVDCKQSKRRSEKGVGLVLTHAGRRMVNGGRA